MLTYIQHFEHGKFRFLIIIKGGVAVQCRQLYSFHSLRTFRGCIYFRGEVMLCVEPGNGAAVVMKTAQYNSSGNQCDYCEQCAESLKHQRKIILKR
jgi:hypothetical protein